ncbi:MAG: hypothetical protein A2044_01335 [Candidatus Firestonebacteria bacterium GWA2_43_8]|nr:MAG: hypothetical protein A2044_01335 [Candidatus Firestonebacteria bacterium GWA2_43_8]
MNEEELQKLLLAATEVLQKGDKDKAISLYEDIISKDPNNAEAHMRLAELYSEKGLKEKATHELLLLGNAYYESRLFKNALKYFQKVLEIDPAQIDARIKAAEIYVNEEMEREAKLEYLAIAEHYLSSNDLNKAEEFSKKAIDLKSIEAHYIMGLVHFKRGMFKEAAGSLETLVKIKVNHVGALLHLGYSQVGNGKFSDAAAAFERVLKTEPGSIDALKGLTDAFAKKGSSMEAAGYYVKAMDAMLKGKVYDDAVKFGLDFVKGSPTNAEAHFKLAQIYEGKGTNKEAAVSYKTSGDLYLKQKMEGKAKEAFDKVAVLDKTAPAVLKPAPVTTPVPAAPEVEQTAKKEDDLIERTGVKSTEQHAKPKADPMRQSFIETENPASKVDVKPPVEAPKSAPNVVLPAAADEVTPLTEAKGDVDELFSQAEKHMKDGFFEKAIEIYRVILKKEPRNNTVRQKLHQSYLLLAQQEEEIGNKNAASAPKKDAPKEKKSKISYL